MSRPKAFPQSQLLYELACPLFTKRREVSAARSRGHRAPRRLLALALTVWLPYAAAVGAAFSGRKEEAEGIAVIPRSAGQRAEHSSGWRLRKLHGLLGGGGQDRLPKNQCLPSCCRTFPGGGCCYCFGSHVGTAPGYLCASAIWQWASPFLFFSFKETPAEGKQETPTVYFSRA